MAVRIGNVIFPYNVFCAVGARGFFGEGYWFHRYLKLLGLTWKETNFAAKTTTWEKRVGNMSLADDGISPSELFPRCIVAHLFSGHVLNAVGLSGSGAEDLLGRGLWQSLTEPFAMSFMAVGKTAEERKAEYLSFATLLEQNRSDFEAKFILQLNFGCPNAGLKLDELFDQIIEVLGIMAGLGIPIVPNFNPLVPPKMLKMLEETGLVAGFWIANTIPYDHDGLGRSIFGKEVSPLLERGFPSAGGISGPRCLPYVLRTVFEARRMGVILPIVGGNGVQTPYAVKLLAEAGADAVAIGTIAMVPPRMVFMRSVIKTANMIMGN